MFIEDKTLQPILVKPGDLVIDELVQAKELVPLLIELEDFQPIEFEMVNNHLTSSNIKATNVFIHHYHNLFVQDNDVVVSIDPNDMFGTTIIDVYLFGVFNPKCCVHS
jgi:hypothetical protein